MGLVSACIGSDARRHVEEGNERADDTHPVARELLASHLQLHRVSHALYREPSLQDERVGRRQRRNHASSSRKRVLLRVAALVVAHGVSTVMPVP